MKTTWKTGVIPNYLKPIKTLKIIKKKKQNVHFRKSLNFTFRFIHSL